MFKMVQISYIKLNSEYVQREFIIYIWNFRNILFQISFLTKFKIVKSRAGMILKSKLILALNRF